MLRMAMSMQKKIHYIPLLDVFRHLLLLKGLQYRLHRSSSIGWKKSGTRSWFMGLQHDSKKATKWCRISQPSTVSPYFFNSYYHVSYHISYIIYANSSWYFQLIWVPGSKCQTRGVRAQIFRQFFQPMIGRPATTSIPFHSNAVRKIKIFRTNSSENSEATYFPRGFSHTNAWLSHIQNPVVVAFPAENPIPKHSKDLWFQPLHPPWFRAFQEFSGWRFIADFW